MFDKCDLPPNYQRYRSDEKKYYTTHIRPKPIFQSDITDTVRYKCYIDWLCKYYIVMNFLAF